MSVIAGTPYRALRKLNTIGEGAAYLVEHVELRSPCMLRLPAVGNRDRVSRACADWLALGRLRHPNIVRVRDAGVTARGLPYYVTDRISGETLRQRLTRRWRVTVPEALEVAREIAAAVVAAQAIGVTHGALAPDTVFLVAGARAQLFDFGTAELAGVRRASNRYLAPEQVSGARPDVRADVYGVGLVLFEMVTGRPALASSVGRRVLRGRRRSEGVPGRPPRLAEVVPGVAHALSEFVARLLAHEPAQRPSLADSLAELQTLELRYQFRVSTTQETAHYVTRRLPFLVDTTSVPSELAVIVPLPSQTLEGIPWTVVQEPSAPVAAVVAEPAVAGPAVSVVPALAAPCTALVRHGPGARPPAKALSAREFGVRWMLVVSCSLLGGVAVTTLARHAVDDQVGNAPPAALPSAAQLAPCLAAPAVASSSAPRQSAPSDADMPGLGL